MSTIKNLNILVGLTLMLNLLGTSCRSQAVNNLEDLTNKTYSAAYVVNGQSNSISVIDLNSDEVTMTIPLNRNENSSEMIMWPHHINLNRAGSLLAVGVPGMDISMGHESGSDTMGGSVAIVDIVTGQMKKIIHLSAMNHNAIFSPDDSEIWTSQMQDSGEVEVFDANTYALKKRIQVEKMPAEVTFSADGTRCFVANSGSNTVTVIDPSTKENIATLSVGKKPIGAWMGTDGKAYVDNEEDQSLTVIDVKTLTIDQTLPLGFTPGMAAYNSISNELWVTDSTHGKVVYFQNSKQRWEPAGTIETGTGCHAVAFTRDGSKAYITDQLAKSVSVINSLSKTKIKDLAVGDKPNGIVIREIN